MTATSLGMALYSELKRDINCGATVTPLSSAPDTPPNGITPKKATVTPLHPLPVTPSNGAPISCSGFSNNTPQHIATPSLPLDDLLEKLDLTEWEKLDPGMLVDYIKKGREWIQDILDGTAAAIEYKKRLAAENPEKKYSVITMPFRFLKSILANGYVDTPPGWKTRKQKAMEAELAKVQKYAELALQLQQARKRREEGILMLQIEEMLANPSGDLFKKKGSKKGSKRGQVCLWLLRDCVLKIKRKKRNAITPLGSRSPICQALVSMPGNLIAGLPGPEQPGGSKCNQKVDCRQPGQLVIA